jgi:hypothetical protein
MFTTRAPEKVAGVVAVRTRETLAAVRSARTQGFRETARNAVFVEIRDDARQIAIRLYGELALIRAPGQDWHRLPHGSR